MSPPVADPMLSDPPRPRSRPARIDPAKFLPYSSAGESTPGPRVPAEAGLSMVEVMIAIAILATLALSTLLTLVPIGRQTRLNRELQAATHAVGDVLERIHATPFNDLQTLYPDGQTASVSELQDGQLTVSYDDPTADPAILTLTLSWNSPQISPVTRTFTTVRTE